MNEYVTIRIMKKYLIMLGIIMIFICGIGGYYVWCSYHPIVDIQISYGGTGKEGIKIQAPHIAISGNGIAEPSASVELKLNNIVMQHEAFCKYIGDNYETSDIKLDMETKDNQTTLKYYGTATTNNGEVADIDKNFEMGFVLDANIIKK